MNKGERTHERILRQAAGLFNRYGYGSTPLSAIMSETGLKKGGLYGHFPSKEEMAIEAFRCNTSIMADFLRSTIKGIDDPVERLRRLFNASIPIAAGEVIPGGCAIMNAAVEADDAIPSLREEAAKAAEKLRAMFREPIESAKKEGRFAPGVDPESLSYVFLSALEGGMMLAKLHGIPDPLLATLRMMNGIVDSMLIHPTT
ncbi:MAG TPA: TetR/AcrR family transcriptional regulator [Rectinemataceae bacterium]|nr:TetR/AcrR family transcriptional regulator [Rectinemataceae bacterium]